MVVLEVPEFMRRRKLDPRLGGATALEPPCSDPCSEVEVAEALRAAGARLLWACLGNGQLCSTCSEAGWN